MRFRGRRRIDGAGFRIGCVRRDSIIATRGGFLSDAGKRAVVHRDVIRVARRAVAIERHDDRAGVLAAPPTTNGVHVLPPTVHAELAARLAAVDEEEEEVPVV